MKKLKHVIIPLLLLVIGTASIAWAGTTGKIAGTVTDQKTGEPLPGASVVITGTTMGAASDINGHYTILYVPPGTYNIEISYIGYRKISVDQVRVNVDQTARIDVKLEEQVQQLQELVILAQRNVIKPDVATSVVSVSSEEIQALPIVSVISALGLQAGIRGGWDSDPNNTRQPSFVSNSYSRGKVSVQGGLNIRGGEGDNVLFQVDGVTMRDPRNNEPLTRVPLSSVQEINVERGGFNAEYGQVRSGIVNVITKQGGVHSYSGNIQLRYSAPASKYWKGPGILDIQDPNSFVLRPYFDPAVAWTGTENGAWDRYTQDQYPTFEGWNEVSRRLNTDGNPNNDLTPAGAQRAFMYETRKAQPNNEPDYDIDAGFGGPVPFVSDMFGNLRFFASYRSTREMLLFPMSRPDYRDYDINVQVNSDITPSMKLRLSSIIGKQYTMQDHWSSTGSYYYPRTAANVADRISNINFSSDLVGMFSDYGLAITDIGQQAYAAKFSHTLSSKSFYEVAVEYVGRDYFTRPAAARDTSNLFEVLPGFFENSNPFGYLPYEDPNAIIINGGQHIARARDNSKLSTTTIKADFTSQINFQNLLKGGLEFAYNDLNFDYGTIASGGQSIENYQNRVKMRIFPFRAAVYLQDKLELLEFTVNAGLRVDYSNSNVSWITTDKFDERFFSNAYEKLQNVVAFPTEKAVPQWQVSPRVGIAHPITEKSKLFFNYGHFKQLPQYESIFRLQRDASQTVTSYGNPDIILAKTISYELGFDYLLTDELLIQMAAFYNDITDQQDFTSYISRALGFSYTYSTSNNYQDTRGFELTLRKTAGRWWSGFANYTYQVTTTGHFGSSRIFDNLTDQNNWDTETRNSYLDRPVAQPYARVNLNFNSPMDFGPEILGHKLFGGLGLNVVFDWQAGPLTTYNPGDLPNVGYNVKVVDYYNTYLRFDKTFDVGQFRIQLFVDMNNVLNTHRLWNTTGDQQYMASLHFPESQDYGNIPGNDEVGDYRTPGVDFQPMINGVDLNQPGIPRAWYFQESSGKYYEYNNAAWSEVDAGRVDKAIKDKAYIDMPNAQTYWFLDPRRTFFGVKFSFNLGQ